MMPMKNPALAEKGKKKLDFSFSKWYNKYRYLKERKPMFKLIGFILKFFFVLIPVIFIWLFATGNDFSTIFIFIKNLVEVFCVIIPMIFVVWFLGLAGG